VLRHTEARAAASAAPLRGDGMSPFPPQDGREDSQPLSHRVARSFSMMLSLVVLTPGKTEGKVLNLPLAQFLIGRDPQCQLRPASPSISKRHCAVIQRDGKAFIRDFDSTNGTLVNDQPVKGEQELHDGDELKDDQKHAPKASASDAAKVLLEKYMGRPG